MIFSAIFWALSDFRDLSKHRGFFEACPKRLPMTIYGRGGSGTVYVHCDIGEETLHGYIDSRELRFEDKEEAVLVKSSSIAGIFHPCANYVIQTSLERRRVCFFPKNLDSSIELIRRHGN